MTSPTRDEARERLAAAVKARMAVAKADARHRRCDPEREFAGATVSGLRLNDLRALLSDQPRPSVSEDICDAPSLRESPGKRAKPYRWDELFGILNHVGDLWTFETFRTRADAQGHIDHAQQMNPKWDLSRHRVVPVKITVSVSNRKDGSSPKTTDKGGE